MSLKMQRSGAERPEHSLRSGMDGNLLLLMDPGLWS